MIARRNKGELFGENPDMVAYSASAKTTALYRIDQDERRVSHIQDLPGAGDTAFASVIQTGPHTFLFANYTSPLDEPEISWIDAQLSEKGTQIYFMTLEFPASE